ncbi:MAG TPA: FGGY family carbohydrate kinase [Gaiellaceae bacterium]|nr:FGGY family carbohydrate kinase [Gaiellaceae bacterium]
MILAVDQGTTGTTCLLVDHDLQVHARGYAELPQHFPQPGWVEHEPEEIWASVLAAAREAGGEPDVVAIANQRETTLLWNRATGEAVAPALVWQDRRTAARCAELDPELIRARTGLVPDPYFSATKLEWLLRAHRRDGLAFGTVDSWLVWKLTGGERHVVDVTNASRTLLVDIRTLDWDDELLELFGVDRALLPEIVPSAADLGEGELLGRPVRIRGIAGDQQAALYGQGCRAAGDGKATYGTGSFVLVHSGDDCSPPPHGLLRTAAADGYALEGAVLVSGAAVQWLRDGLGLVAAAGETEHLARSVDSSGGVVFVPALAGLGSPWWDADARGLISGLTRGTTRAHLVRAALEGIAHQVADVVDALPERPRVLHADGGASANGFLMQLQADLLGVPVEVAAERETTALGAAALACGRGARVRVGAVYEPAMTRDEAAGLRAAWREALIRTSGLIRTS